MNATVGRIVHYVGINGRCQAAVVVDTPRPNAGETEVDPRTSLCVLEPSGIYFVKACNDEERVSHDTWHWPERT